MYFHVLTGTCAHLSYDNAEASRRIGLTLNLQLGLASHLSLTYGRVSAAYGQLLQIFLAYGQLFCVTKAKHMDLECLLVD